MTNTRVRIFIGCLAGTLLLLFRHGYTFGSGDQSEMLPYAKYLENSSLYKNDFYIQSISSVVPNERYFFSLLLSLFGDKLDWAVFGLHFATTMLLVLGLYRFTESGIKAEGGRWLTAYASVLFLYGVNLGGNELYYNTFVPSYVAQVIGLWIFIYAMRGEAIPVYVLLMVTTYIHPLIGVQLWLLFNLSFFAMGIVEKKYIQFFGLLMFNLLYIATAGFFIFKIKSGYDNNNINTKIFLDIIAFRAPHHYFPHTFPLANWFILALPFYLGWRISGGVIGFIFRWTALGTVVYLVGVYIFKNPTPLSMQWFSTTVWIKTFSIIITMTLVNSLLLQNNFYKKATEDKNLIIKVLATICILTTLLMPPQYRLFKGKAYDFPFLKTDNSEVVISKLAKEYTPQNALFLIPSDLSEFRFWSERSSFIDYKATNHRQAAFVEWYQRIQDVYKISLADRLKEANLTTLANQHFQELKEADFLYFAKNQGVTHVLTYKNMVLDFEKVIENDKYVIYKIAY